MDGGGSSAPRDDRPDAAELPAAVLAAAAAGAGAAIARSASANDTASAKRAGDTR